MQDQRSRRRPRQEALKIYRGVSVNNFNTIDFALLRAAALREAS